MTVTSAESGAHELTAQSHHTALNALSPASSPTTSFQRSIHAERLSEDRFAGTIDDRWQVMRGPNGGYLAALLLQTLTRRLDDPTRRVRVLSLQYPQVPATGAFEVRTQLSHSGRSMSWLSAELWQGERLCVVARAAFSSAWSGVEYAQQAPPVLPSPEEGLELVEGLPPFTRHYHYRSLFATPFQRNGSDAVGGYIRLRETEPYTAPLLAALADAWFPSAFAFDARPTMAATLDLTVHFRDYEALDQLDPRDYVLSIFRSRLATEGFFEEDGELWSRDGRLIAQSRQLAIAATYGARRKAAG